jgi:hypothetical protein
MDLGVSSLRIVESPSDLGRLGEVGLRGWNMLLNMSLTGCVKDCRYIYSLFALFYCPVVAVCSMFSNITRQETFTCSQELLLRLKSEQVHVDQQFN